MHYYSHFTITVVTVSLQLSGRHESVWSICSQFRWQTFPLVCSTRWVICGYYWAVVDWNHCNSFSCSAVTTLECSWCTIGPIMLWKQCHSQNWKCIMHCSASRGGLSHTQYVQKIWFLRYMSIQTDAQTLDILVSILHVGWVFWPIKPVPDMTYNVFGGTLNLAQFNSILNTS